MVDVVPHKENATRETSARPPRPPLYRRDWSAAQQLIRDNKITIDAVASHAGLPKSTVSRALNFKHFYRCELINVARVRAAVEDKLREQGVLDNDIELADLWADYDHLLNMQHLNQQEGG